jgi:hypothetical protein
MSCVHQLTLFRIMYIISGGRVDRVSLAELNWGFEGDPLPLRVADLVAFFLGSVLAST